MENNAVGIDVSKGRSMVCILRPYGEMVAAPFEVRHTNSEIDDLIKQIRELDGETKIVMESTGRYQLPLLKKLTDANLSVSLINAKLIKDYQYENTLRRVKSDKADSKKISAYILDKWTQLKKYGAMDKVRDQLKTINRQFDFYIQQKVNLQNNVVSLMDLTFPGVNNLFSSPVKTDGHCKWLDFAYTYWHADCVCKKSLHAFSEHYHNWCRKNNYNYSTDKAKEIYHVSSELVPVLPKDDSTKKLIYQSIDMLYAMTATVESLRKQLDEAASQLPEYPVVMDMKGVGHTLGPQLMAEIGDVTRFSKRSAITAYAGVDPGVNESGDYYQKSVHASKHGSPELRETLFQIMEVLNIHAPEDDPVYSFMVKKKAEGKKYYVYMTAAANKFLRIYYGKVKAYLKAQK